MTKIEKQIFTVTLAQLREEAACVSGYNKLVCSLMGEPSDEGRETYIRYAHKEPINLLHILESNGVDDCLWALRAVVHPERDRISRHIACDCAAAVLHVYEKQVPNDKRPRTAIDVARRFADGEATQKELAAARDAAWAAAWAAAGDAAWAAAGDAAGDAARDAARDAQAIIIRTYLTE